MKAALTSDVKRDSKRVEGNHPKSGAANGGGERVRLGKPFFSAALPQIHENRPLSAKTAERTNRKNAIRQPESTENKSLSHECFSKNTIRRPESAAKSLKSFSCEETPKPAGRQKSFRTNEKSRLRTADGLKWKNETVRTVRRWA